MMALPNSIPKRSMSALKFIATHIQEKGFSPSNREIGEAIRSSSTSVTNYHIQLLCKNKLLVHSKGKSRALRLSATGLSLAGFVVADPPSIPVAPVEPEGIFLILPFPPSVNHLYMRLGNGRVVKTEQARAFSEEVALCGRLVTPIKGAIRLDIWLYRPARRGDIDNYNKALLDALQGVVYEDDKQVVEMHIYLDRDPKNPRTEVRAQEVQNAS